MGLHGVGHIGFHPSPPSLRVAIVITAGVTEEVLYRGYPIERLFAITGSLGLSASIPYILFVVIHIPVWGVGGSIQIGVWALIVTYLYVKGRNLCSCMLMHILNDAYAIMILSASF
jgi:membrane protease YdiL (CAAX protease family)